MMWIEPVTQQKPKSVSESGFKTGISIWDSRSERCIKFYLNVFTHLSEVKHLCEQSTSIPVYYQELMFHGKAVSNRKTLQDLLDIQGWTDAEEDLEEDQFLMFDQPSCIEETKNWGFQLPKLMGEGNEDRADEDGHVQVLKANPYGGHTIQKRRSRKVELNLVLRILKRYDGEFGRIMPLAKLNDKVSKNIVKGIMSGLNKRLNPGQTPEGLSGSYFLKDRFRNNVAIFKPMHEEPFAPLNPKGMKGKLGTEIHESGINSGELYLREVAAWLMDEKKIFSVPETFLAVVDHPFFDKTESRTDIFLQGSGISPFLPESLTSSKKNIDVMSQGDSPGNFNRMNVKLQKSHSRVGSIQKMIWNNGCISNISISLIPTFEIQKIALLDLRILNADRNEGNILFQRNSKGSISLIPIDHGLSLGKKLKIKASEIVWTNFPQIKKPLDPKLVKFVKNLKPKDTLNRLSKHLDIDKENLLMIRFAETFLKMCVKKGLSLFEISQIYYRFGEEDKHSHFEKILNNVQFISSKMCNKQCLDWYLANKIVKRAKKINSKLLDNKIRIMKSKKRHILPPVSIKSHLKTPVIIEKEAEEFLVSSSDGPEIVNFKDNEIFSPRNFTSKEEPLRTPKVVTSLNNLKSEHSQSTENYSINTANVNNKMDDFNTFKSPVINKTFLLLSFNSSDPKSKNFKKEARESNFQITMTDSKQKNIFDWNYHQKDQISENDLTKKTNKNLIIINKNITKKLDKLFLFAKPENNLKNNYLEDGKILGLDNLITEEFKVSILNSKNLEKENTPNKCCSIQNDSKRKIKRFNLNTDEETEKVKPRMHKKSCIPLISNSSKKMAQFPELNKSLIRKSMSLYNLSILENTEEDSELFFSGDFRQKSNNQVDNKIRKKNNWKFQNTMTNWPRVPVFKFEHKIKTKEMRERENNSRIELKFHYFKCNLEQFLEGWVRNRPRFQAKRKNTAPIY